MKGLFLFLGSGASLGIPVIGCSCSICKSDNIYNKRTRPSALITFDGKSFLIDAGPDFRRQALKHKIDHLDGVILTHAHFDHIAGIDELRPFSFKQEKPIPCLFSNETFAEVKLRFHYLLKIDPENPFSSTKIHPHVLMEDFGETLFEGLPIIYCSYYQAGMKVLGLRLGNFAYITDIQEASDKVLDTVKGVETLVISALRWTNSKVHFSLGEAVQFAEKTGAKKTWITHIAHDLDHDETNKKLPSHVQLSYDGLKFSFEI